MTLQVIVGAGPVGSATAIHLARQGHHVRLLSRSGGGPVVERVERVPADATDTQRLASLLRGAEALYDCASPPYHRWATDWPPLAAALLAAAERAGVVLVTMSNLYAYGPVDHPISERDPLRPTGPKGRVRAAIWMKALAAHQAGRVRVTEARASDYFGPGARQQATSASGRSRGCCGADPCACSAIRTPPTAGPTCSTSPPRWPRWAPTSGRGAAPGTCRPTRR